MNTDRKVRKKKKRWYDYSVRYSGDPVWHPLDHMAYIRLSEKDSKLIELILGKPVVIEKARKKEEEAELRRVRTIVQDIISEVVQRKPQVYQDLEPYSRSREGMKKLTWQHDDHKNLSFIPANTYLRGPFGSTEDFYCYDVTNGPSDEELLWTVELKVEKRIITWFSMEHFDLSITKRGTEYDIRPIHKYYRRPTYMSRMN